jgi:ribose/xylose/arabinose/galactoside ABC-type transport system permease subunit
VTAEAPTRPETPGVPGPADDGRPLGWSRRALRAVLTRRELLLVILLVVVLVWMTALSYGGYLTGPYNPDYLAGSLVDAVPLTMLALAELLVIVSGRGGIDLSIGSIVSLTGMVFGFAYGVWGWPLLVAIPLAIVVGGLLGAVNGVLVAWLGFPALITTLATYYAYKSLAIVINDQKPISTPNIQGLYSLTGAVELPLIGRNIPDVPLGVFTFLVPTVLLVWLLLTRTTYGRRLFAIGTNDVAATWSGVHVARTRLLAYVLAGLLAGAVAVYVTGQFASARPDVGTSGNGLALPAITIAVLGGVAITGGIGRVSGVLLAAILITWLDAGILLMFEGNNGTQFQLLALGTVLVFCALLNSYTIRRYGGTR